MLQNWNYVIAVFYWWELFKVRNLRTWLNDWLKWEQILCFVNRVKFWSHGVVWNRMKQKQFLYCWVGKFYLGMVDILCNTETLKRTTKMLRTTWMSLSLKCTMTPHSNVSSLFHRCSNWALIVEGLGGWWDLWENQGYSLTYCVPNEVLPRELFADMAVRSFCTSDTIQAAVCMNSFQVHLKVSFLYRCTTETVCFSVCVMKLAVSRKYLKIGEADDENVGKSCYIFTLLHKVVWEFLVHQNQYEDKLLIFSFSS